MGFLRILPLTALVSACAIEAPDEALEDSTPVAAPVAAPVAVIESAITTPEFRSLSTTQNGDTIYKPAGVMAGDFLLAALEYDADPVQITPPTGWTLVADQISGVGTPQVFHALVFSHVATTSEPSEYMFYAPYGVYVDIQIAAYTGVTQVDQVSGVGVFTSVGITAPNLFTTVANELLVGVFIDFEFGSWTTATDMTQRSNFDANSLQDEIVSASFTGKHLATCTTGQQAAVNILLK